MKKRVLYVCQEISPYTGDTTMGNLAGILPQKIQESGKDIRMFLPRFGTINERRHQLHEVIRLSGMNLIIDDFYISKNFCEQVFQLRLASKPYKFLP